MNSVFGRVKQGAAYLFYFFTLMQVQGCLGLQRLLIMFACAQLYQLLLDYCLLQNGHCSFEKYALCFSLLARCGPPFSFARNHRYHCYYYYFVYLLNGLIRTRLKNFVFGKENRGLNFLSFQMVFWGVLFGLKRCCLSFVGYVQVIGMVLYCLLGFGIVRIELDLVVVCCCQSTTQHSTMQTDYSNSNSILQLNFS